MADTDPYGFFTDAEPEPRKKRVRTKRPQARDVEAPVAPDAEQAQAEDAEDADPYGFFADDEPPTEDSGLKQGPPPGPAGAPEAPQRGGTYRTEEPAWYEPLLESAASFYQGLTQNTLDDVTAGYAWAFDKVGLTNTGHTFDENRQRARDILSGATSRYPIAHGAGQATAGIAAGAAASPGALTQGLVQGALSAGSEYADSGDLWEATKAGGLGLGTGFAGGVIGNQAAKRLARVDATKGLIRRGYMTPDDMAGAPKVDITKRGGTPLSLETVPPSPTPQPLPTPPGRPYDPLAAQTGAVAPPPAPNAPVPRSPYQLGDLDGLLPPASAPPQPRVGTLPVDAPAPSLDTIVARRGARGPVAPLDIDVAPRFELASRAQKAAATPPGAGIDRALSVAQHVPGLSLPARAGRAGLRLLGGPDVGAREAGVFLNDDARQIARGGFEAAWEMGAPGVRGEKVNAQEGEPVAYADQATTNYALSEVLASGRTGLSQQDEETLTSAVVRGDDDAIRAADFRMRQKYPAYARQVERALRGLNEED